MAEFKISDALTTEISNLNDSGNAINNGYSNVSSDGVNTLTTSMRIIEQHKKIKELLDVYKSLVSKDVSDLNAMVEEAKSMDEAISASQNT